MDNLQNPENKLRAALIAPLDIRKDVTNAYTSSDRSGEYSGFESLDNIYTAKKGYPLFIYGAPHSGKSQIAMQMAVNWADLHGWKGCVYLGENGSPEEVLLDLIEIHTGKRARAITERGRAAAALLTANELENELAWAHEHFRIIDGNKAAELPIFDLKAFHDICDSADIDFDYTILDPWNDLTRPGEMRDDIWLTDELKNARVIARRKDRVDIIINHVTKLSQDGKTQSGLPVSKPARPTEVAGGQTWFRRAFTMLLVYRPPANEIINFSPFALETTEGEVEGYRVGNGEVWVECQKAKPRGSSKLGWSRMYFDVAQNRYYEADESGENSRFTVDSGGNLERFYAGELKTHRRANSRNLTKLSTSPEDRSTAADTQYEAPF
jgi:hypothetical protein